MKLKNKITKVGIIALASLTLTVGVAAAAASSIKPIEAGAYYSPSTHYSVSDTASELASYYSSISDSDTGTSLLSKLQSLNSTKRKKTVGYDTMGTDTGGAFIYTDYDLNNTATDSNGQKYGTKVASFYTKTSATSWNREHTWPKSHGGKTIESDILMTRPTISSENSDRGNSFYVEGKSSQSAGWDPYTAGYAEWCRGECARIILYGCVANSDLSLSDADSHSTTNANPDNLMGNMNTLIKWHYKYSPSEYEINRNNGAEYLQGNRNPFVDHPEYVARIWSNFNSTVSNLVTQNESTYSNWTPGSASSYGTNDAVNESSDKVTLDKMSASIAVGASTTIKATSSNGANISWTTSNSSVASLSSNSSSSGTNVTVTGNAAGTATITASATINGSTKTKSCTITVSTSGGGSSTSGTDGNVTLANGVAGTDMITWTEDWGTMVQAKASGSNFSTSYISSPRIYTDNTLTFTTNSNYTISKIVFSCSGTSYVDGFSNSSSSGSISVSGTTATWTGSDVSSVVFTPTAQVRPTSITVTYAYSGGSSTTKTLSYIYLGGDQTTDYYVGDTFSFTGTCYASYSDGSYAAVTPTSVSSPTMTSAGTKTVTVSYTEGGVTKSTTYDITVSAKTLSSLAKSGTLSKTSYYAGESFDYTGLTFTATFSDSSTLNVSSQVTFSPSPLTAGTTSVTASYTYGGTTKTVTVSGLTVVTKTLQSLSKTGTPSKTTYNAGESFNASGLTVTATFNGGTEDVTSSVVWTPSPLTAGTTSVTGTYTYNNVSKTVTVTGLTVSEVQETYHVTLTTSNNGLSGTALSSSSTISYSILNSSDVDSGSNMKATWSAGCLNTTKYNEITIPNGSSLTPGDNTEVKSILIDWYHGSDNATIKANGVTVEGTSTTLDGSSGVPTLYTFTSATSNWSINGSNATYAANAYSITFEITALPHDVAATGVTVQPQAASIAVGGTTTLTASVLPSNASNKAVTWSSNKTSVATVSSSGVVTGVAVGSATITATTVDGGYTASCLITVSAQSGDTWELASSISAGDTIVFAYSTGNVTAGDISNKIMASVTSTFSSDKSKITSLGSGTVEFTVGTSGSNYTFTNSSTNKLLGVTSEKNLAWASGTTTWTVSISSGTATVGSTNTNYGKLYYNTGSPRFTTYKNAQASIQIYKKTSSVSSGYTADNFATDFLNALTCDVTGNNAPTLSLTWTELKTKYNNIDTSAERAKLTNATYSISGSGSSTVVTATGTTTEVVALAMSRYDILISKYSSTYSDNFIGRPASAQQNLFITQSESSTTMMIVIVSIISISAISGFVFLKKRKEN